MEKIRLNRWSVAWLVNRHGKCLTTGVKKCRAWQSGGETLTVPFFPFLLDCEKRLCCYLYLSLWSLIWLAWLPCFLASLPVGAYDNWI